MIGVLVTGVLAIFSVPVIVTTAIVVILGLSLNIGLNKIDDTTELSGELKKNLRNHIKQGNNKAYEHDFNTPYFYSF